jgi:hypothetical protein
MITRPIILSAETLRHMTFDELLALFETLEVPSIAEMNGEYAASLLRQPNVLASISGWATVVNPLMPWLCKSFRPVDEDTGRGYNTFKRMGRVIQKFPMQTIIAPSRYDGKPAYTLVYRAFQSFCGDINMVDEVRRLGEGLYLGMGTWGFSNRQRRVALPFLLEQTPHAYRGDIGKVRKGFVIGNRELPALNS